MPVSAPFVWRCLSGSAVAPFPHPAHRTGHADFPHPALGQDFTPSSRATPSAASEHHLELIGCPVSMPRAVSCVCLELRSLPSTRVTRFPRYYEPLRHPRARPIPHGRPVGPVMSGPDHALGLPVLRALSLCAGAAATTPVQRLGVVVAHLTPAVSAFPRNSQSGRPAHRPFRGLLGVHSRCGPHTRAVTYYRDLQHRRLQPFRHLHDCSGCVRLRRSPGGTCTHWRAPPSHGARKWRSFPEGTVKKLNGAIKPTTPRARAIVPGRSSKAPAVKLSRRGARSKLLLL